MPGDDLVRQFTAPARRLPYDGEESTRADYTEEAPWLCSASACLSEALPPRAIYSLISARAPSAAPRSSYRLRSLSRPPLQHTADDAPTAAPEGGARPSATAPPHRAHKASAPVLPWAGHTSCRGAPAERRWSVPGDTVASTDGRTCSAPPTGAAPGGGSWRTSRPSLGKPPGPEHSPPASWGDGHRGAGESLPLSLVSGMRVWGGTPYRYW
jgi:hypothetical protein